MHQKRSATNDNEQQPNNHGWPFKLAVRRNTPRKYWNADQSDYERSQRKLSIATLVFSGFAAGGAIAAAVAAFWAYEQTRIQATAAIDGNGINSKTLIASNRAWLAPASVEFVKSIEANDGPIVSAIYQNVGRFPAMDVKATIAVNSIELDEKLVGPRVIGPRSRFWPHVDLTLRTACSINQPVVGGGSVFPSSPSGQNLISGPTEPIDKVRILAGEHVLIAQACLVYRTFDETHRSIFCQFATNVRSGNWEFLNCPVGNFAQ
jgi:hypothetical protein